MNKISASSLVKVEPRKAEVDASAAFGEKPGEVVLVFSDPDAPKIFEARKLATTVKKKKPAWTDQLCQSVGVIAISHASPELDEDPLDFYIEIASANADLFFAIENTIKSAFPDQYDFGGAIAKAKKD